MKIFLYALKWAPISLLGGAVLMGMSVYFLMYPLAPSETSASDVFTSPVFRWFELWNYAGVAGGAWLVFRALTDKADF